MENSQVHVSKLDWDTTHFNFKTGHVSIDTKENVNQVKLIEECILKGKEDQYKLLYLKLPGDVFLPENLLNNHILLADRKVIYAKIIGQTSPCPQDASIYSYSEAEADETLLKLSYESGKYSRFKLDKHFPPGLFEKMYAAWMDKSVKKEIADDVLVSKNEDIITGMLTYSIASDCATIGLIAVDHSNQGKHIGSKLIRSLEGILQNININRIEVATQKTNPACLFYEKNNFILKNVTNIYHIWL